MIQEPAAGGFANIENALEPVGPSVIRIRYFGPFRRGRVEVTKQMDLAKRFRTGRQLFEVPPIFSIRSQDVIEALEKGWRELLGTALDGVAAPASRGAGSTVGAVADVPAPDTRALDGDGRFESSLLHQPPHHGFCRWRPADIPHAHEADSQHDSQVFDGDRFDRLG